MTGTLVNAAAILVGGALGLCCKRGVRESIKDSIMKAEGVAVLIIGLNGVIGAMFTAGVDGVLSESGSMLLLLCLVIGTLAGELLHIDDGINALGRWVEKRFAADGFAKGFVSASIIFCVGSMAILGSLNDGLTGDSSVLFVKSVLDGVTALILASTMGVGVLASAAPVFLYQGLITLSAGALAPILQGELLRQISMAGYAIVLCIGLNFLIDAKIKTANMLPAILLPVLYNLLLMLKTLWI